VLRYFSFSSFPYKLSRPQKRKKRKGRRGMAILNFTPRNRSAMPAGRGERGEKKKGHRRHASSFSLLLFHADHDLASRITGGKKQSARSADLFRRAPATKRKRKETVSLAPFFQIFTPCSGEKRRTPRKTTSARTSKDYKGKRGEKKADLKQAAGAGPLRSSFFFPLSIPDACRSSWEKKKHPGEARVD